MIPDQNVEGQQSLSMAPYNGTWTKAHAAHLLRRTLFGPTHQQITNAVTNGMNATVTSLLQMPVLDQPLSYDTGETIVPYGSTWITSVYPSDVTAAQATETARIKSLGAWMMKRLNSQNLSIGEKMCLFWQNHFAATAASDARATYNYHMLLYTHALGNFKQLVKDITIDPCMLLFLNGATNTLYSPNENYSRELLELFTVGKGPQTGPGEYTNYNEDDVAAGAKILTGYLVDGLRSATYTSPFSTYVSLLHDVSTKQLSPHFGNTTVTNNGANEYADYIDIIFQQPAVANFICKELYRYFVNYDITTDVETNVIPAMASTLITNNYNIASVMDQLLKSEHFYSFAATPGVDLRGSIIRGPLEVIFGMFNATSSAPTFDLTTNSDMYLTLYWLAETMGQAYATPPSVAGWSAYYQEPSFSQLWVNSTHIKTRFDIANYFTVLPGIPVGSQFLKLNALAFLNGLSLPSDANVVIDDLCDVFFPKAISLAQKTLLFNILTGGQGAAVWYSNYIAYAADPTNTALSAPIKSKVEQTLARVFQMPEFQTI